MCWIHYSKKGLAPFPNFHCNESADFIFVYLTCKLQIDQVILDILLVLLFKIHTLLFMVTLSD